MKILSSSEIIQIDRSALTENFDLPALIAEVGVSLALWFSEHIDKSQSLLFLIGPGNNGNDGLALAKNLIDQGYPITLFLPEEKPQRETRKYWLDQLPSPISEFDLGCFDGVVDAFFGIGLDRPMTGIYKEVIERVNRSDCDRIAIDAPSGLNCENGQVFSPCFKADTTLCVSVSKPGHWLLPGRNLCGNLIIIAVQTLDQALLSFSSQTKDLPDQQCLLKKCRARDTSHKYTRGQVCLVMSETYPGAALLAASAAQRAGAGYIKILAPSSRLAISQIEYPHFVFAPYSDFDHLRELLSEQKASTFVLGPGWDLPLLNFSQIFSDKKIVIDGGLIVEDLFEQLASPLQNQMTLTPHLGELQRLFASQECKWDLVQKFRDFSEVTLVAKGFDSLISQRGRTTLLTTWNSPSLAMAGSGDILAGLIGSFLAQGLDPYDASSLAVDLHRRAALSYPQALTPDLLLGSLTGEINSNS